MSLVSKWTRTFRFIYGESPPHGQIWGWKNSLPGLARICREAGLGKVEMLIGVEMPQAGGWRADVVLAGRHPVTGLLSYVVVELKQ